MTVTFLGESPEGRRSREYTVISTTGAVRPVVEYTRVFRVRTTDKAETGFLVLTAVGLPELFDEHPSVPGALVRSRDPRLTETPFLWDVEIVYSTETGDPSKSESNPLYRPTEISFGFQKYQKPIAFDRQGLPVVNSAGEAFDPPVEVDDSRPTITFQKNLGGFDPQLPLVYQDAINNASWFGFPAYTVKVSNISSTNQYEQGLSYWRVTYEFEIRWETWWLYVLDQGSNYKDANGKLIPFLSDTNGQAPSKPVLLDGNGGPLRPGYNNLTGAKTTLVNNVDASTTTVRVTEVAVFQMPEPFLVQVGTEAMYVSVAPNGAGAADLTVTRGYGGTTAAAHTAGDAVQLYPYFIPFRVYRELDFSLLSLP